MDMFDFSAVNSERYAAVEKLNKAVLDDKINPNCDEGPREIAQLLTFLPEEATRLDTVYNFVVSMLVT